ncbi:GNAT family N-acetyltransferase [Ruegeria arenilitoris]|uniref:GNAT family N-acetyltransferase n=1 Tax=Ruegeria arenilitoris TaxID=1173585 RepID=UPI00147D6608|nr:GNAT family N-acetyltransferase [Ruegeria arenilitoris]
MTEIPTLETERLLLRPPIMADWPDYLALMTSERSKFMGGPVSDRMTWGIFCHDIAQWTLMGHGALMMEDRVSGACLGQVSINSGPLFPEPELGWFVYADAEGKGYAFEAARTLRDWACTWNVTQSLVSYIDPNNFRSCRLAERLGGILDSNAERDDPNDLVYRYH